MAIKEFTVGFSRTINLGNYESARVEAQVTYALDAGENVADMTNYVQIELRNLLEKTWNHQSKIAKNGVQNEQNVRTRSS